MSGKEDLRCVITSNKGGGSSTTLKQMSNVLLRIKPEPQDCTSDANLGMQQVTLIWQEVRSWLYCVSWASFSELKLKDEFAGVWEDVADSESISGSCIMLSTATGAPVVFTWGALCLSVSTTRDKNPPRDSSSLSVDRFCEFPSASAAAKIWRIFAHQGCSAAKQICFCWQSKWGINICITARRNFISTQWKLAQHRVAKVLPLSVELFLSDFKTSVKTCKL